MARYKIATKTDTLRYKIAKEVFGEIEDSDGVRDIPSWEIFEKTLEQHQEIKNLVHENKLLAKALELACEELYSDDNEGYCKTPTAVYKTDCEFNGDCTKCKLRYFKQKAEKELKDGNTKS